MEANTINVQAKAKAEENHRRKGKGKGPVGGCHECQGDHYVRDCPVRAQRKGGKGKGKDWNNVAPRQWNTWNPGFINKQWSNWRPGYGGKGEKGFRRERVKEMEAMVEKVRVGFQT